MGWVFVLIGLVSMWRLFQKAGRAPWKSVIPVYNAVVLFEIADRPAWQAIAASFSCAAWALGRLLLPDLALAMIVSWVLLAAGGGLWLSGCLALAQKFDRGTGFGLGLAFLPVVFLPILAFGSASYGVPSERTEVLGLAARS